jgi:hypothetical protein
MRNHGSLFGLRLGLLLALAVGTPCHAQGDALVGQRIFGSTCLSCHGTNPTADNFRRAALTPTGISDAINTVSSMRFLRNNLTANDIAGLQRFFEAVNLRQVAVRPQPGAYWNPFESGRGFVIETSGNVLAISAYYYAPTGRATWSLAAGALVQSRMQAPLVTQRGGQTLSGPYVAPQPATNLGTVEAIATSERSMVLNWPGGWVLLERASLRPDGVLLPPRNGAPEVGFWWAPEEDGRGYVIDIQDDQVFMAGYMYDAAGEPLWYIAVAALNARLDNLSTRWLEFAGGQTLTGPYQPNRLVNGNVGPLVIEFDTPRSATLVLPDGRRQRIVRFF